MGNEKDALVQSIHSKQVAFDFNQEELEKMQGDLAEALLTKSSLEDSSSSRSSPVEKVFWGFGSSALGFGVATEALGDVASWAALKSDFIGRRVALFEKQAVMQRLMEQKGLCWSGSGRNPLGRKPLWKAAWPFLAGGAATFGAMELVNRLRSRSGDEPLALSADLTGSGGVMKEYTDDELAAMSTEDLQRLESNLGRELSGMRDAKQQLKGELTRARKEVIVLKMQGVQAGELDNIKDAELQAMAQKVVAAGRSKGEGSFLEQLNIWDGLGIYAGFGFGTKILHGMYDGLAPWRPFIRNGMNGLSAKAEQEAAEDIEAMMVAGVLQSCGAEPSESKAVEEVAPAEFVESKMADLVRNGLVHPGQEPAARDTFVTYYEAMSEGRSVSLENAFREYSEIQRMANDRGLPFEQASSVRQEEMAAEAVRQSRLAAQKGHRQAALNELRREGYRPANGRDVSDKINEAVFPSQRDAVMALFGLSEAPGKFKWNKESVHTADGKQVFVKDGDWYAVDLNAAPANDNGEVGEYLEAARSSFEFPLMGAGLPAIQFELEAINFAQLAAALGLGAGMMQPAPAL